ncbi:Alcohol dehydrogenase superfamily [Macleaya cordata]|uniref:Alcohol dehydrogenase superfamily n=1 Tax=Macleaya cordata TaxID=56857 RepID=A0A200Q008_MACCD|nr:Alcohol dehydrogenase superfamily [Macleaya cordata]
MASSTLQQTVHVKLNSTNYLLWQSYFSVYLRGHQLYGFVDGTNPCPPRTLPTAEKNAEGIVPENSAYTEWVKQDQLLLSAIFSSITEGVHTQLVGSLTSREAWLCLERSYASPSQARVMQLTHQLQNTTKGTSSVLEYLVKMKSFADSLAAISQHITHCALVLYVLSGLGPEYGPFVTSMTTRPMPVTFDDLQGYLISHELRLAAEAPVVDVPSPNVNISSQQQQQGPQGARNNRSSNNGFRGRDQGYSCFRGHGYYHGRGHDKSGKVAPFTFKRRVNGVDDVTIKILYCGMCHTDLHYLRNDWGITMYPVVPGHEITGVITKVGSNVEGFKVGDRVGVGCLAASCLECEYCKDSQENYCEKLQFTYNGIFWDGSITYGGYSKMLVADKRYVVHVPEGLPLDAAAPLLCAGITVFTPLKDNNLLEGPGKKIGVVGLGGLGHVAVKFGKAFGHHVTVISTSPSKENEAKARLGADHFIVSTNSEQMQAGKKTMDFIIDTVSAEHSLGPILELLKVNGTLSIVGAPDKPLGLPAFPLIFGKRAVKGSIIGGIKETQEMLDLCAKHNITCDVEVVKPDQINEALDRLARNDVRYRFVIDIASKSYKPMSLPAFPLIFGKNYNGVGKRAVKGSIIGGIKEIQEMLYVCAKHNITCDVEKVMAETTPNHTQIVTGWAGHDQSGKVTPFTFKRRENGVDDVTIEILYCGMCHTDLHYLRNDWGITMYPIVPGHEITGVITKVGSNVGGFKVGDRVGVGCLAASCLECEYCKDSQENYCEKLQFTYNGIFWDGSITYGGYSKFLVADKRYVVHVPESLPLDAAAPLLCAGITVFTPLKDNNLLVEGPGKKIGVVGLGGLGHVAVKFGKAFGHHVTVISTSPSKENEAKVRLGADNFIVSTNSKEMQAGTRTLDFIIDTVSAEHSLGPILELLKVNGTLSIVGAPDKPMGLPSFPLIFGKRTVRGSIIGGMKETQEMLDLCAKHNITCDVEVVKPDQINEALNRLARNDVRYRFVIDIAG